MVKEKDFNTLYIVLIKEKILLKFTKIEFTEKK